MNRDWRTDWDYRPTVRLLAWGILGAIALGRAGIQASDLQAILRELILGFLLTAGILTRIQFWIVGMVLRLLVLVDDWTYAAAERCVKAIHGDKSDAMTFFLAFATQISGIVAVVRALR